MQKRHGGVFEFKPAGGRALTGDLEARHVGEAENILIQEFPGEGGEKLFPGFELFEFLRGGGRGGAQGEVFFLEAAKGLDGFSHVVEKHIGREYGGGLPEESRKAAQFCPQGSWHRRAPPFRMWFIRFLSAAGICFPAPFRFGPPFVGVRAAAGISRSGSVALRNRAAGLSGLGAPVDSGASGRPGGSPRPRRDIWSSWMMSSTRSGRGAAGGGASAGLAPPPSSDGGGSPGNSTGAAGAVSAPAGAGVLFRREISSSPASGGGAARGGAVAPAGGAISVSPGSSREKASPGGV